MAKFNEACDECLKRGARGVRVSNWPDGEMLALIECGDEECWGVWNHESPNGGPLKVPDITDSDLWEVVD